MSRSPRRIALLIMSFPRVSGDEPAANVDRQKAEAFSPRERG